MRIRRPPSSHEISNSNVNDNHNEEMESRGGLIFFLHVPKTGGTSIRRNFENLEHVEYIFGRNYSVYWNEAPKVEDLIQGKSLLQRNQNRKHKNRLRAISDEGNEQGKVLFFEVHASTAPSFYNLRQRLARWRQVAKRNQVPVFFFTVVRDPIAFAISHFNYFHVDVRNPSFEHVNATQENFLRFSLHNPQCQFLFKGEASMRKQLNKRKTKETSAKLDDSADSESSNPFNASAIISSDECSKVQDQMLELFDWIGTTETLSNETLPLLADILGRDGKFATYRVSDKVKKVPVDLWGKEHMTDFGRQVIQERSQLDLELYHRIQEEYPYCMWKTKDPQRQQYQQSPQGNENYEPQGNENYEDYEDYEEL
ncbi:unnamed protein product [Cylindrotheca closterium]|uniref:Sulfotransferase domain-containing protein n=1 Tax=Cylindrotheca closterium TaxID=2856 RepID=A0AAD2GDX0_9STRA|nr:unnamed protein product [Cylindrotheca closterium]